MELIERLDCSIRGIILNDEQIRMFQLIEAGEEDNRQELQEFLEDCKLRRSKSVRTKV